MKTNAITKIAKKLVLSIVATASFAGFAQEEEEEKKFSFGGSVDAYFRTNLTSSDQGGQAPATSFADETGFALGMANMIASYEHGNVGAVADLAFGPRGVDAVGSDVEFVNQLYAYWNVSENTTLTFGRFNTYLGYEVISPTGNFNYSTSYLFSNGPFSHVGLKADFSLSEDFSLMLALMNVTDTNFNFSGSYALGAQLGYKGQYLNFYYDDKQALGFEIDYTGGFDVSEGLYLGINAAYADNDGNGFYGAALYPQLKTSDVFSLGLRGEYFATFVDVDGVDDTPVFAATLTGSYEVKNLTIKPELRLDSFGNDAEPFFDNDGDPTNSLSSFSVAAIYSF